MSSPTLLFICENFPEEGKYFPPAPCSLAYHFVANLKIVDMQARQATSRGVNRGHTWVGRGGGEIKLDWGTPHPHPHVPAIYVWLVPMFFGGATKSFPHRAKCFPMFFRCPETSTLLVAPSNWLTKSLKLQYLSHTAQHSNMQMEIEIEYSKLNAFTQSRVCRIRNYGK